MRMKLILAATIMTAGGTANAQPLDPLAPLPTSVVRLAVQPARPGPSGGASSFVAYQQVLAARARAEGIRPATIAATIPYLKLNQTAIRLDRAQPGQVNNPNAIPPFAPYRRQHVTSSLINRGQARYSTNWTRLAAIERRFGVEPQVLMAIYGHETSYGSVIGNFDLLDALSTLAYEGRRREFFEDEFIAALRLLDRGTPRSRLKGSWAGATGYPQFMPSAVLRLAVDGDGDGVANIWSSEADGLASIASYLRDAGWKPNIHWGVPVRVPSTLNRRAIVSRLTAPRCERVYARHSQWKTMREWRALGVAPTGRGLPENEMATLIEPDGPSNTAYLLSTNYRAILDYNCSNFYALSVGLLADAIASR
ncbi:lytic murein transglycosylase [Sphingomonas sp. LY160]|uniref:lytic murein transglycosylase n=1 Tax=Sphingomonas sp. LY160 TaxID=3095342 RepID=UPI002ADEB40E|nr:lytic murein transglycosylase [Sphingomonas sp. LY160]MEA1071141.1 lytic murein transglycosylase [Sphingomonas sp. LY160]